MSNSADKPEKFSAKLEAWLYGKQPKTIDSLGETFAGKSFAVIILFLMLFPALPLPTGGITHVFEIIAMLAALELIAGFNQLWLPPRLKNVKLVPSAVTKAAPVFIKRLQWLEDKSSPKFRFVFRSMTVSRLLGLVIFCLTLVAFLAPPFSGLDTLPSLGVVLICASIILEDALILLIGFLFGLLGTVLVVGLGAVVVNQVHQLL